MFTKNLCRFMKRLRNRLAVVVMDVSLNGVILGKKVQSTHLTTLGSEKSHTEDI